LKSVIINTDGQEEAVFMPSAEARSEGEMVQEALEFQRLIKLAQSFFTPEYMQELAQSRDLNLEESAIEISALMAILGLLEDYLAKAAEDAEERAFLKPILGEVNEWEANAEKLVPELYKQNMKPVFVKAFSEIPNLKTDILTYMMQHVSAWAAGEALRILDVNDVASEAFSNACKQIASNHELVYNWLANALSNYCSSWARSILDEAEKLNLNLQGLRQLIGFEPDQDSITDDLHELGRYAKLPQAKHTNALTRNLTVKQPATIDLNGKATILDNDFKLYIEGFDKLVNGANTSAVKFFDAAVITCSKNRDPLARIPLKEYMELRGLKDEKEARKQIKADMEVLKAVKFEYKGTGKGRGDWLSLSLYGGRAGIYRGVIEFRFTPEFYASIPENQFMFIPKEYFSTRDKYNPHTAYFIRRIAEHKRMNLGKPNENIIGVETLVNASPTFPKYEDVNYRFTQFILEPFERDMDAITSIKWHYAGEQPTNYNEFITSSVVITWVDYPDVAKLTQRKKTPIKEENATKKRSKKRG
jgi:hypothetical protein